jgi:hypothetical protein
MKICSVTQPFDILHYNIVTKRTAKEDPVNLKTAQKM